MKKIIFSLVFILLSMVVFSQDKFISPEIDLRYNKKTETIEALKDVRDSVVCIIEEDKIIGTGIVYNKEGFIITNKHVVADSKWESIKVLSFSEKLYDVEFIYLFEYADIAIIKIKVEKENDLIPIRWGDSNDVRIGQDVYVMGHPLGFVWTVTKGSVGAIRRNLVDGVEFIHTDTLIMPGNSGGPVLNEKGEMIGLVSWGLGSAGTPVSPPTFIGVNFALNSNLVRAVCESFIRIYKILKY